MRPLRERRSGRGEARMILLAWEPVFDAAFWIQIGILFAAGTGALFWRGRG